MIEIERKFLVNTEALPSLPDTMLKCFNIKQGYLSTDPAVRIRLQDIDAILNIKGPGTISKQEFEYTIPFEEGVQIYNLSLFRLEKIRYYLIHDNRLWEVDEYLGNLKGHWTAEIELRSEDEAISIPSWVTKEVTLDKNYSNASLARKGWPHD